MTDRLTREEQFPEAGREHWPKSPLGANEPGIPTGRDVEWEPLVDYRRAGVSETTIHGAVAWASGGRIVHSFGGNVLCYGRSMMKPLMIKQFASVLADCTWEQKAIAVSSGTARLSSALPEARQLVRETRTIGLGKGRSIELGRLGS